LGERSGAVPHRAERHATPIEARLHLHIMDEYDETQRALKVQEHLAGDLVQRFSRDLVGLHELLGRARAEAAAVTSYAEFAQQRLWKQARSMPQSPQQQQPTLDDTVARLVRLADERDGYLLERAVEVFALERLVAEGRAAARMTRLSPAAQCGPAARRACAWPAP
jgi:hypothetical protein